MTEVFVVNTGFPLPKFKIMIYNLHIHDKAHKWKQENLAPPFLSNASLSNYKPLQDRQNGECVKCKNNLPTCYLLLHPPSLCFSGSGAMIAVIVIGIIIILAILLIILKTYNR